MLDDLKKYESPSSRRAWIEIPRKISISTSTCVALLAEGVDRNTVVDNRCAAQKPSPSSRRAWIEMNRRWQRSSGPASPSSRRAWIEIDCGLCAATRGQVALLAEGVDRNQIGVDFCLLVNGRPPRGGRG